MSIKLAYLWIESGKLKTATKYGTGGPRYMREIGTPKIDSNKTNSNIKRPRMTDN